jgi:hypothetical protein
MATTLKYLIVHNHRQGEWATEPDIALGALLNQKSLPQALDALGERGWDLVQVPDDLTGPWVFKQPT